MAAGLTVPRLIIVPTPIGNLEDITLRALSVLRSASLVLAEDTRHTRRLLRHHQISAKLLSYHQHNERQRLDTALHALQDGDVALVSNAGTPSISDPGFELIHAAIAAGVEIDVLPGANAAVTAVVGAAIPSPGFLFFGFLPRRSGERRARLRVLSSVAQSLVFYEAPHRITATLQDLALELGDRYVVVGRELTKIHQEWIRGSIDEVRVHFADKPARGELTLVVTGAAPDVHTDSSEALARMRELRRSGEDRQSAIAEICREFALPRNQVYRMWVSLNAEFDRAEEP